MKAAAPALAVTLGLALGAAPRAQAVEQLIADLSKDSIEITTGFTGTDVLLFGAIEGEGDIMVVVRGPENDMVVRRKERVAGIWVNRSQVVFENVPSFYRLATSGGIHETVPDEIVAYYGIGVANLALRPRGQVLPGKQASFRAGLIRVLQARALYDDQVGDIAFLGPGLFSVRLFFPANVETGVYDIRVYLLRHDLIVSKRNYSLVVKKIGVGAEVFRFAHERPAAYGAIAIALALFAGWFAAFVFRRG